MLTMCLGRKDGRCSPDVDWGACLVLPAEGPWDEDRQPACEGRDRPKELVVTNMTRTRGRHCNFEMWDRRRRAEWVPCRTYSSSELSSSSLSTLALGDAAAAWGTAGAVPFPSIDSMGSWLPEP